MYDLDGRLDAELGLSQDRAAHAGLVQAVIGWAGPGPAPALQPRDFEQISLQLTGHGRVVAAELRYLCGGLPPRAEPRVLAEVVLEEAERRLGQPRLGTARCAQMRARQVRALYERLDRIQGARLAATPPS
ncbi:DUF6415 family natural product biosynthesis protein [Streptomyces caniferus]